MGWWFLGGWGFGGLFWERGKSDEVGCRSVFLRFGKSVRLFERRGGVVVVDEGYVDMAEGGGGLTPDNMAGRVFLTGRIRKRGTRAGRVRLRW